MSIRKTTYIFISRNTYKMKKEEKDDSLQSMALIDIKAIISKGKESKKRNKNRIKLIYFWSAY